MVPQSIVPALRCPRCRGELIRSGDTLTCRRSECGRTFPVVGDVPILIDEDASVFTIAHFTERKRTYFRDRHPFLRFVASLWPSPGVNLASARNFERLRSLLHELPRRPRVLVVGGGIVGAGARPLLEDRAFDVLETDVAWEERTALICDAHSLPFADGSVDAVVAQAVLEHVADPFRCVAEIHRVLAPDGLVYAETPFMQQVHGGAYDFMRFSLTGHHRLFREFTPIDRGAVAGPATALVWSWEYFLVGLFGFSPMLRDVLRAFARLTGAPVKHLDRLMIDRPAALDGSSGTYFLGRRSDVALSDRDITAAYRGAR